MSRIDTLILLMTVWYAGAYAPAYQKVIYIEWHKLRVALIH